MIGQFEGSEKFALIALESVVDHTLRLSHTSFGFPSTLNDVNVWGRHSLCESMLHREHDLLVVCIDVVCIGFNKCISILKGIDIATPSCWSAQIPKVSYMVTYQVLIRLRTTMHVAREICFYMVVPNPSGPLMCLYTSKCLYAFNKALLIWEMKALCFSLFSVLWRRS